MNHELEFYDTDAAKDILKLCLKKLNYGGYLMVKCLDSQSETGTAFMTKIDEDHWKVFNMRYQEDMEDIFARLEDDDFYNYLIQFRVDGYMTETIYLLEKQPANRICDVVKEIYEPPKKR